MLLQIQKKLKQNLRKHGTTPTSTVAPPLPTITTVTTAPQSSPHPFPTFPSSSSPPHKDLTDPLATPGDHIQSQKPHPTGHTSHTNQSHRPRNKDRERKDAPQKRISADAPIPPAKRKNRRRKLSSSNESSTSEAPSNASDFVPSTVQEQAGGLVVLRDGGGGRRGEKVGSDDMLHRPQTYPKLGSSRASCHSVSPVHELEAKDNRYCTPNYMYMYSTECVGLCRAEAFPSTSCKFIVYCHMYIHVYATRVCSHIASSNVI